MPSEWDLPFQSKHVGKMHCSFALALWLLVHLIVGTSANQCALLWFLQELYYSTTPVGWLHTLSTLCQIPLASFSTYSTRLGGSNCSLLPALLYTIILVWSSLWSKYLCPTPNSNVETLTPWRWYLEPLEMLRSWREKPVFCCMRLVSLFKKKWVEWNSCLSLWSQNEKLASYGKSGHHQNWICWWLDLGCLASRTVREKSLLFV